jgi:hypothetical protein
MGAVSMFVQGLVPWNSELSTGPTTHLPSGHGLLGLVDGRRTYSLSSLRAPLLAVEGSRRNLLVLKLLLSPHRRDLPVLESVAVENCTLQQDPLVTTRTGHAASVAVVQDGELRGDELLQVALAVTRPEHIGPKKQHVVRKHVEGHPEGIHLPIRKTVVGNLSIQQRKLFLDTPSIRSGQDRIEKERCCSSVRVKEMFQHDSAALEKSSTSA